MESENGVREGRKGRAGKGREKVGWAGVTGSGERAVRVRGAIGQRYFIARKGRKREKSLFGKQ